MTNQRHSTTSVYLASKSPRRRELLQQIGVPFALVEIDVVEQRCAGESPHDYVARLAKDKSQAGYRQLSGNDCVVIGADTVVVDGQRVLEKPENLEHAQDMLMSLSARQHCVMTAVALTRAQETKLIVCRTEVCFRSITEAEAREYWATGEPADKAGGYAIQGLGAVFIERIEGSYSNVVGLPLLETSQLLAQFGVACWQRSST